MLFLHTCRLLAVSNGIQYDHSLTELKPQTAAILHSDAPPGLSSDVTQRRCVSSTPSDLMAASARACAAASCALLLFAALVLRAATTFCWISEVSLKDRLCEAESKPLDWGRGPGLLSSSSMKALPRSRCAEAVAARLRIRADSATWACMLDLNRPIWRRRAMTVQAMREGSDAAASTAAAALRRGVVLQISDVSTAARRLKIP